MDKLLEEEPEEKDLIQPDPDIVVEAHKRFDKGEVEELLSAGVSLETASAYPERFSSYHILVCIEAGVPPDAYPESLAGHDIASLVLAGVSPEVYSAYPNDMEILAIVALVQAGVSPEVASAYPKRFSSSHDILACIEANVPPETASAYPERFSSYHILVCIEAGVSPEVASAYPAICNYRDITALVKAGISPEIVSAYPEKLIYIAVDRDVSVVANVLLLAQMGIDPEEASKYFGSCSNDRSNKLLYLIRRYSMHPRIASAYLDRFCDSEIMDLMNAGVSSEITFAYPKDLYGYDIVALVKSEVPPETASAYLEHFKDSSSVVRKGETIIAFVNAGVPPEIAFAYPGFNVEDIIELATSNVPPEVASKVVAKYNGLRTHYEIVAIAKANARREAPYRAVSKAVLGAIHKIREAIGL